METPQFIANWSEVLEVQTSSWYLKRGQPCGLSPEPVGSAQIPGRECRSGAELQDTLLVSESEN